MQALWQGRLDDAERLNSEGAGQWHDEQDWMGNAMRLIVAYEIELLRGRPKALEKLEAPIRSLIPADPLGWAWRIRLALLLAKLERWDEARELFDELSGHDFADLPREQGYILFAAHLSELAGLLNDTARAGTLYQLLAPYHDRMVNAFQFYDGPVSHFLGLLSATLCDWEQARSHLEDSIKRSGRTGTPPYEVRSKIVLGEILLREGSQHESEGRALLQEALPAAEAMGMLTYADRARRLLLSPEIDPAIRTKEGAPRMRIIRR
jgi:tetratricopeptide (TPR) repeat protein